MQDASPEINVKRSPSRQRRTSLLRVPAPLAPALGFAFDSDPCATALQGSVRRNPRKHKSKTHCPEGQCHPSRPPAGGSNYLLLKATCLRSGSAGSGESDPAALAAAIPAPKTPASRQAGNRCGAVMPFGGPAGAALGPRRPAKRYFRHRTPPESTKNQAPSPNRGYNEEAH